MLPIFILNPIQNHYEAFDRVNPLPHSTLLVREYFQQSLGSQNDKLKSHYEALRTELIQLRKKHNTTRKQLLEAVEGRVEADQRTETLVNKWKVQLEARTRELESLQAKLVPQDLDMLRAKVQEELEVPHHRRVALLEAEVEKHRQMFCKARREHERCRVS